MPSAHRAPKARSAEQKKEKAETCLECESPIRSRSRYTFFCSKDCAANWADDEVLMQALEERDEPKTQTKPN